MATAVPATETPTVALDHPFIAAVDALGGVARLRVDFKAQTGDWSGTLTGAKALSGFVPADDGHVLTFSFVYNGPNARESAASLWDRFARTLAAYPYRPDLTSYSPVAAR